MIFNSAVKLDQKMDFFFGIMWTQPLLYIASWGLEIVPLYTT